MGWESLSRELRCSGCQERGQFTYDEPDGPYIGGGMANEKVSDGFVITKNTGIALTSEISCAKCKVVVKPSVQL